MIVNKNIVEIERRQMMLSYQEAYLTAVKAVLSFHKSAKTKEERLHWKQAINQLAADYSSVK